MNRRGAPRLRVRRPHGIGRGRYFYAATLLFQLLQRIWELDVKAPVTLGLIFMQMAIYVLPHVIDLLPRAMQGTALYIIGWTNVSRVCLHPAKVLLGQRWRLVLSSFVHLSDLHILHNMSSFLYKGVALESSMGSETFLALIVYLSFAAHALYVAIALVARFFGMNNLMYRCVAGFSGVIFGLKVVVNSNRNYSDRATRIFGMTIPGGGGGVAPWSELILAQILVPNASFLGHLTGILAGLIYISVPKLLSRQLYRQHAHQS